MRQAAVILECGSLIFIDFDSDKICRIFTVSNKDQEIDWSFGDFLSLDVYSMRKVIGMLK